MKKHLKTGNFVVWSNKIHKLIGIVVIFDSDNIGIYFPPQNNHQAMHTGLVHDGLLIDDGYIKEIREPERRNVFNCFLSFGRSSAGAKTVWKKRNRALLV